MSKFFFYNRCQCRTQFTVTKRRKSNRYTEGKPIQYPKLLKKPNIPDEVISKTFYIKYEKNLSLMSKFILNSFRNKYIYYAIDDILYLLNSNPIERDNLLFILYSPMLLLQNNFYINFFDIWIQEVYIKETSKPNKFLSQDCKNLKIVNCIIIKLLYKKSSPIQKVDSLW